MTLEKLMRWVTPLNLVLTLFALAALPWAYEWRRVPFDAYRRWRYPDQGPADPRGRIILEELEKGQQARLARLHAKVAAEIQRARAEGHAVSDLETRAGIALQLNRPDGRAQAERILNEVRRDIPPTGAAPAAAPAPPSIARPAPVPSGRRKARASGPR